MSGYRTGRIAALLIILTGINAWAGGAPKPVVLTKGQIAGAIFKDYEPIVEKKKSEKGSYTTSDVEAFLSSDEHFDAGMYQSGPNRFAISELYGVDEFMYFLKGGVTLTSKDGTVQVIKAGDAVVIPKEWMGVWETKGYTKIYVIYSPDKPIE